MSLRASTNFSLKLRHPERSEAANFLFPQRFQPCAVEGPSLFCLQTSATKDAISVQGYSRRLCEIEVLSCLLCFSFSQSRSFDSSSAQLSEVPHQLLAFAQDDGAFY